MTFIFPPEPIHSLPVMGFEDQFPVRRIYCVGQNYAAHAREMGRDPTRASPFFFCKPADALCPVLSEEMLNWSYPMATHNLHPEVELVVAIGKKGCMIPASEALSYVWGYAVGLDMTRRDLQTQMKEAGKPWEISKAFDHAAPIGILYPVGQVGHIDEAGIELRVNGLVKQKSNINQMIWPIHHIIQHLSHFFELYPGDLIMTGTPQGVSAVDVGDIIEASINGLGGVCIKIV